MAIFSLLLLSSCSYIPDKLNPIEWASDGYDWVYLYENEKIPIEQKTRTMLFNGSTYQKNNVKKYIKRLKNNYE